MKVSANAVRILKEYERGPNGRWAEKPYLCPAKKWTVGWGHVILTTDKFTYPMDEAAADAVLMADLNKYAAQVEKLLKVTPTQDEFDALVLLAFNVGVGKADGIKGDFADSTLLAYYNAGKKQLAAAEFAKWIYSAGKVMAGLIRRRKTEATLFLTGKIVIY